jgi:invasion protein IalB
MIRHMVASALVLIAATAGASAQFFIAPLDKVGMGRVQTEADGPPLVRTDIVYSPWTRRCQPVCTTKKTGTLAGKEMTAAYLLESDGRRFLFVQLPGDFRRSAGARIAIDDDTPRSLDYVSCSAAACTAHFAVDAAFVARLKTGRHLEIQGVNATWQWTSFRVPLEDFAAAVDRIPAR